MNFDGIVGPTHHYGGLAYGNLASMGKAGTVSNPREAALRGLEKMKLLMNLGIKQGVIPPQERPHIPTLRRLGFRGIPEEILARAAREAPDLLTAVCSASSMWTANAATVSPAPDTSDGKIHVTPANLISHFHRSIEAEATARILRGIFQNEERFVHHPPLQGTHALSDEGAANHMRLSRGHGEAGLEVFVYGRVALGEVQGQPARQPAGKSSIFPARQALEASQAIARLHGLPGDRTLFIRQNPALIDAGVFHNDIISVSNGRVLFFHGLAFNGGPSVVDEISRRLREHCGCDLISIEVRPEELTPEEAVATYLFNSQIITLPDQEMALIAPVECREDARSLAVLERVLGDRANPINRVHYVDVRQSMKNGGGPACLRLRVVLAGDDMKGVNPGVILTDSLYEDLKAWISRHYRDRLFPGDLGDRALMDECFTALDELTRILHMGSIYDFQGPA